MQRIRTSNSLSTSVVLSAAALLLFACNDNATSGAPTSEVGGSSAASNSQQESSQQQGKGGSSPVKSSSSKASKGGSSQASERDEEGGSASDGGASAAESNAEGGVAEKGGSTQAARSGASGKTTDSAKGGTSSSVKAMGGTKATGGSGAKVTGGASSAKGGTTSQGGSSGKLISSSQGGGSASSSSSTSSTSSTCTAEEEKFSFFLASQNALVQASGNADGFGGDLGGITGADAICQRIAEASAPCHKGKVVWHAFLSTSSVNAKERIGNGPWYDRRGRLLAKTLTDLINERPIGADTAIASDFPNENGVPNHSPDGKLVDNHQTITGTGTDGNVYKQAASGSTGGGLGGGFGGSLAQDACLETWSVEAATCKGWTTNKAEGCPRVGHSWYEGSGMSGKHWISVWNESGCAPGGTGAQTGGTDNSRKIGSGGGYGGFYCFAVTGQ